jgi:hypothetical protein
MHDDLIICLGSIETHLSENVPDWGRPLRVLRFSSAGAEKVSDLQ